MVLRGVRASFLDVRPSRRYHAKFLSALDPFFRRLVSVDARGGGAGVAVAARAPAAPGSPEKSPPVGAVWY